MAKRKNFTFRLDPDIVSEVAKEAEGDHRSLNNMIELTLLDLLRARGKAPAVIAPEDSDPPF